MAAYINRSLSQMAGDGPSIRGSSLVGGPGGDTRNLHDSTSPLQIFVKAKKKINGIFVEIEDYVRNTASYMQSLEKEQNIIQPEERVQVESYIQKVKGIRDVLTRDHMKVAFFGRTSNGKSTVINAMLRDKILPSGIGHTTNCFLQVEGSENGEAYLVTEDSKEKQNVKSVGQLAHALCKERLGESTLVRIFWPKDKCLLLRDDVVFVDSPGIDVSPNLDEWIDRHCLDADVFVLVANAESTLMVTEKNFFHKVSTRLSKPNIFILNNRWDASASEPEFLDQRNEQSEVRGQHMERTVDFLVRELKVCSLKEANERIFFVSAKEVLQARLMEQKGQPAHAGALAEGFPTRYFEFQDFERKFEECISKSAVKTKFAQHSQRGKLIASEIHTVMDGVYERAEQLKSEKALAKKELYDRLNYTEQQLRMITQEMKEKIHQMVEDVEQRVSKALSEEIRRLSVLVDEFNLPFHPEQLVLNVYKKELHAHVENGLGSNLRARLSTALAMNIENSQREMTERMSSLLPPEKKQVSLSVLPRREPFEILYRLNCDNLCADFHEDLEFRFSWGITALINRFTGKQGHRIALHNYAHMVPRDILSPSETLDVAQIKFPTNQPSDDWSIPSRLLMASIGSQGTMGGLLVAGFLLKTVGWRLILVTGAVYGCLYLYERLTWTNKAKERAFKRQYVAHATKKLRLIVDLTSANCSHQVQQELSSTFARLCHLVDEASTDMDEAIKSLEKELRSLEEAAASAKSLRNKANYLAQELAMFEETYLQCDN
ncbi:transmembrane GTPase Marf isoform X1 [Schistocerca americana]|uniref:transmembrane GTPase Marf isoform X1 n=1 Tax=Schistocerca americana TaxID=7009 RepID=UPI001F4F57C9|nr:transmembrane GTPase Marf isoform X1 [Schistocerca americana]XP_046995799.1 transmembrane GTPase Marf isoform X1 [Schistocerca americana]XP_046995800.1 transmembrane GTPase Marf isoform X1 [Schistocerca americana]XP_046995801.1 transmembrane GTPase Marf isoform X1 [Schistocerca americana]XP_046995802.1 transmembrane GTPase Marf isoform X1 [Schistocerca americana]XP_046995803.1 transmembrane GTPase Marf isoform X1 [Schistocerca americana]XP_046995804.1 transmembrane GTPase Marf isoform X1 [